MSELTGKRICLTGTLSTMTRAQATRAIVQAGGHVVTSLTSATDLLVAGASPGSKYQSALRRGLPIMMETEFLQQISTVDDYADEVTVVYTEEKVIPPHYGDF